MKVTKNFDLRELVHPEIYKVVGDRSFDFLNPLLPITIQALRDEFGPIVINDWLWDGEFVNSGLRYPMSQFGAKLSAHKFGTAADLKFLDADPIQVQAYIHSHPEDYLYITRLEDANITKTWLHVEVGDRRSNEIVIFKPK